MNYFTIAYINMQKNKSLCHHPMLKKLLYFKIQISSYQCIKHDTLNQA